MNKQKGFTLIELLVVIAIIGILSSVVLASLNTARDKGANAAIKSNLANIRAQAEIHYDGVGANTYTGLCGTAVVLNAVAAAKQAAGVTLPTLDNTASGAGGRATCHDGTTAWAIEVPLKGTGTPFQCVDNTGQSTTTTDFSLITAGDVLCG
ncbi:MAG: type II secretion system protein [Patescibacteria group bacterium]